MTADPVDMACEEEENARVAFIKRQAANVEKAPAEWDGQSCIDELCGLPIDGERLLTGAFRCFDCQKAKEDKIKRMKG